MADVEAALLRRLASDLNAQADRELACTCSLRLVHATRGALLIALADDYRTQAHRVLSGTVAPHRTVLIEETPNA